VDLLSVHTVASEVELDQVLVLATVVVLTTVALQAQTFLTNSLSSTESLLFVLIGTRGFFM
jgi:hypothetical protein